HPPWELYAFITAPAMACLHNNPEDLRAILPEIIARNPNIPLAKVKYLSSIPFHSTLSHAPWGV
ncbi:MAG: hypothetical protein OCU22_09655, partial [Canidatus Methanoxibalbensis ujae]|nr:hypothetical protein [Candidatus Methanoxibalbensis ujae]